MYYQLTIHAPTGQQVEYIGTFATEKELEDWANENPGTLKQYEEEEC